MRLYWLEDPVPAELQEGFRLIRRTRPRPSPSARCFNSIWDCHQLITEQLIDFIRTTVVHAGGITHLRRIFDLAGHYHVRTGSHGATDLSPVCMAAALHLDIAVPNFGLQEHMPHTRPDRRGVSRTPTPTTTATCILAKSRGSASTSTRTWRRATRTSPRTSR